MGFSFIRRWALPFSLALNVFLGAVIITHPPPPHRSGPPNPREIAQRIADTLPPGDGAILMEVFTGHAEEFDRSHEALHDAPARIRSALAAQTFSADTLRDAFDVSRAARQMVDEALAATLIESASRMSPEGRAQLAKWEPPRPPGAPPR